LTGIRKSLVIRSGGLGDFILILPCLEAIRRRWPGSSLEILGRPSIAALALNRFQADALSSIDRSIYAGLFRPGPVDPELRDYLSRFDLVVSFLPDPESTIRRNVATVAPNVFNVRLPRPGSHACRQFLQSLPFVDPTMTTPRPTVHLEQKDRDRGDSILAVAGAGGPPRVVIHPGSGSPQKNWPAECFAQVAQRLARAGIPVVFLEGEADHAQCHRTLEAFGRNTPLIAGLSIREVAGMLSRSQLLIGNDSGISHLAAAVGLPVIALFGPSDPEVWRPLGANVEVIRFSEADPERVAARAMEMILRRARVLPTGPKSGGF
jgi:ADP-heptose:LPS heptosyltransferase